MGEYLLTGVRMRIVAFIIFIINLFLVPSVVFAKGGSPKVTDDTFFFVFTVIGAIIVLAIVAFAIWKYKKNKDAKDLAGEIEKYDDAWNIKKLENHVKETFHKVYEARTRQDPSIARKYVTPSLYNAPKSHTDAFFETIDKVSNKRVHLDKVKIMGINDYKDDSKDSFWAYIQGSSYDDYIFTIRLISGGPPMKKTNFREMWKFVRTPQGWVLDRRDPYVVWSFLQAKSFTEGYGENSSNGYLICENCGGYYALKNGESPEDFDVCQCGGSLRYYNDFE